MAEKKKRLTSEKILLIAIIAVATLLIIVSLSLFLLVPAGGTASSPGNIIDGTTGEKIALTYNDSEEQSRFTVENMFPGDTESKTYHVEIKDSGVQAVSFHADVLSESANLSEVLTLNVKSDGSETPFYSGTVKQMPDRVRIELAEDASKLDFEISVSLSTSAGNECQNQQIILVFDWWVAEEDYVPAETPNPNPGEGDCCCAVCDVVCPWCHIRSCKNFCPWCWIIPLLVFIFIIGGVIFAIVYIIKRKNSVKSKS